MFLTTGTHVLASFFTLLVDFSRRFAKFIVIGALLITLVLGNYVIGHIKINTDINQLLSADLGWRKREKEIESAFPQKVDNLVIVIDGTNADKVEAAAAALAAKLGALPTQFLFVSRPDALPFFHAHGLLFLSTDELATTLDQIAQSQPLIGTLVSDPSLRGFFGTIGLMSQGVLMGATSTQQLAPALSAINDTVAAGLHGQDLPLNWAKMMASTPSTSSARELRKFIITKPVLDFSSLQPGEAPTATIHKAIDELGLTPANGITVRLTGSVPLNDEEFASVADGTGFATILSAFLVVILLFLAMRTWRIVIPIALTLCVGLVASTAFATVAVGSLNLISVAFAVMFIGIAVDFGIQFGVRYRDQHHQERDHAQALRNTASVIAVPLAMAAGSTALGFLSFIPTDYRGVSELGLIAGVGMIIAFILNITLLPALMTLTKPPSEADNIGFAFLAPFNRLLAARRRTLVPLFLGVVIIGFVIALQVRFDFDPLDLKNPQSPSVSTMLDVMQDPDSDAYAAELLAPSQEQAQSLAAKLSKLPEVDHVMTLESFIPPDQDKKLSMIADTAALLAPTLSLPQRAAPSSEDNKEAILKLSALLKQISDKLPIAQTLGDNLDKLASQSAPTTITRVEYNLITPMLAEVAEIKAILQSRPVTLADIPSELSRDWVTADGRALVEIFPKRGVDNNPRDPKILNRFIDEIQKTTPDVSGVPVSIRESGRTIVSAFVHAGFYGVCSIGLLSLLILRRWRDVLLMLTPLVMAGILTMATITAANMPLNFANIIALPLLLSLGVSYAVYFVFYARTGQRDFLQSSMARAVLFSAATVLVAFGSLCFSAHPGTRGMGVLLTIALVYSLLCTFIILPVLLGTTRPDKHS